jgi:hypothetical protein
MAIAETSTNNAPVATDERDIPPLSNADALWRVAVAEYERAKAAQDKAEAALDAASAAWREAVPDRVDEFLAYGLNRYHSHDHEDRNGLIRNAQVEIVLRDYKGKGDTYPNAEEYAEIAREATKAVDEFLAWIALDYDVTPRIYGDTQERFDEACDKRADAQTKLLETPAPDSAAMLHKLELLAQVMTESDEQDAPAVRAIRDDCRRLLGKGE